MLIDSKIHALEILSYLLHTSNEREKNELIRRSMSELKRFEFKLDERVFFEEIWKKEEARNFMIANGMSTLEELVMKHYEYRMKYEWRIYKKVKGNIDFYIDNTDGSEYLD